MRAGVGIWVKVDMHIRRLGHRHPLALIVGAHHHVQRLADRNGESHRRDSIGARNLKSPSFCIFSKNSGLQGMLVGKSLLRVLPLLTMSEEPTYMRDKQGVLWDVDGTRAIPQDEIRSSICTRR